MSKTRRRKIDGWMGKPSLKWLAGHAVNAQRVIEVGAWYGRSTKTLALACPGTVWAVDHWKGTPNDPEQHAKLYANHIALRGDPYKVFRKNLRAEIIGKKVVPMRMRSVDAANILGLEYGLGSFDFVFIDADHSYDGCLADIQAYFQLVRPGGVLAGHDYHWESVERAVTHWFTKCVQYEVTLGPSSMWSVRV